MKLFFGSIVMQMIWRFSDLSTVSSYRGIFHVKQNCRDNDVLSSLFQLHAKSHDKPYERDDDDELARIFSDNQQRVKKVTNQKNPPQSPVSMKSKPDLKSLSQIYSENFVNPSTPAVSSISGPSQQLSTGTNKSKNPKRTSPFPSPEQLSPITKPNNDWRNAKSEAISFKTLNYEDKKAPKVFSNNDDDEYYSFTDLDYEDFEQAMREEENGDMGVKASKISQPIVIHHGLHSGDTIPTALFNNNLLLPNGNKCELSKLLRPQSEFLFIFSDPRRLTEDFKGILKQFCTVPVGSLKVNMLAINCDELSDQRKFVKKWNNGNGIPLSDGYPSFSLLTDPSKKVSLNFNTLE